mgnify:CR=1 FL=1
MRIGLISYYFPPESYASAARAGPFAESWAEAKDTVHVFTHRLMQEEEGAIVEHEDIHVHRTRFGTVDNTHSLPVRFLFELVFCLSVIGAVLRHRVDVLVSTSPPFLVAVTTLVLGRLTATPYVVDIRDIYPEQLFAYDVVSRTSSFGRALRWLERQVYDYASLVVGVTEGLCSHIEKRASTDVVLIRNGIDSRQFFRRESLSSGEEFVVIFHGTLGRSQNIELLLQYGQHLKRAEVSDVTLRVIGDGPEVETLTRGIEEHQLSSYVEYCGHVDFDDIPTYLNQADVGFSPRLDGLINETAFPVKVYECLGCGLPVVVTPESEVGRYVERHQVGFQHRNDDIEGIHESILRLKEDAQLYREYSDRAVQVAGSFDRHTLGRRLRDEIAARLEGPSAFVSLESKV